MSQVFRQKLIADHMEMAAAIAADCTTKFKLRSLLPYEDVLGYAQQGLVEAANRYSPQHGTSFRTFSWSRIKGAIIDGVRKTSRQGYSRVEDDLLAEDRADVLHSRNRDPQTIEAMADQESLLDPPESRLDRKRLRARLLKAIDGLPARERDVTLRHYYRGEELVAISRDKGLCHDYVGRIHTSSIRQLRAALAGTASSYVSAEAVQ